MAVVVNVVGKTNVRDLDKVSGELQKMRKTAESSSSRMGRALSGAGKKAGRAAKMIVKAGAVAGAALAAGAVAVGKEVLETGAKLEDMDKKAAAVFEGQLPDVRKWAKANAGAMGLTATELTGLTANFADLLKPMGFTADQAAGMAQETNELAGALAKWSGGQRSAAEVSEILGKAMLGEREALKGLGISITEADVKQRLAANGAAELTGQALEQAKALATQELIMEKSTDAQKAWADGQDDLSVRTAKARARIGELREMAVRKLLPVVLKAIELGSEWAEQLSRHLQPTFEALSSWWSANGPAITATVQRLAQGVGRAIGTIIDTVQTVIGWFQRNRDTATGTTEGILSTIKPIWAQIGDVVRSAVDAIKAVVTTVLTVVQAFWDRFGTHLLAFGKRVFGRIVDVIRGALQIVKGIFDVITGVLTGDWSKAWNGIKSILAGAWRIIRNVLVGAWDTIKTLFGAGVAAVSQVWSFLWDKLKGILRGAWQGIVDHVRGRIESVKDTLGSIVGFIASMPSKIASAASGMWDGIKDAFRSAVNFVIDGWNRLSFTLPAVDLPGPFNFEGATISTPNIPRLAAGGIATAPTLALIGEGRQDEAVIPLPSGWRHGDRPGLGGATFHGPLVELTIQAPAGADAREFARIARREVEAGLGQVLGEVAAGAGAA